MMVDRNRDLIIASGVQHKFLKMIVVTSDENQIGKKQSFLFLCLESISKVDPARP